MKNVCKILLVMCCVCLCSFSGCDEKNDLYEKLDTKKAEQVALEYMIEKYGEGFSVVGSKKEYEAGYVPASIQSYWCDVELTRKDSETMNNYIVRVTLKDNGEKPDYVIEWDNYMTSLVSPLAKRDINVFFSEASITNYFIHSFYISEIGTAGGFRPDFDVDIEQDTLDCVFEESSIWLHFNLCIPESAYKDSTVSDLTKTLGLYLTQENSDDHVRVKVLSFNDDFYSEIKKLSESGNELPQNYEYKSTHEETIKIKSRLADGW